MDFACKETADAIAEDAKGRVPVATGKLRDAIHVERKGLAEYVVIAGDDEAFYGHMVEFGTRRQPPHPFLTPAAEAHRVTLAAAGEAVLKHL